MTMTMLPMLLHVDVSSPSRSRVRLWLPLFLLWPIVLLLLVLPLMIAVIVDIALWMSGRPYHHYSALIVRTLGLLCDTRGMVVRVNDGATTVDVTVV